MLGSDPACYDRSWFETVGPGQYTVVGMFPQRAGRNRVRIGIKTCVRIRSQNPAPSPVLDDYCGVGLCADEPDLPCTLTTLQRSTGRPPTEKFVTPPRICSHLIEGVW